ncbi:MAG TPA: RdgB/HAM1 family non-canonical purine NTP pyrophosphatase [Myxococcota bacterium]|nr:RdgB/HAM1 family non-canonical purine NTP pyrophosphatase [Myxococcota bacterium]
MSPPAGASSLDRPYREVVLATANSHKLLEVRAILGNLPISLRALEAFPEVVLPDEGDEYEANAVAKARAAAHGAGRLALADDSGLEVDGLGGAPGPRSARFGGLRLDPGARNAKLLEALLGMPANARRARFVCVAALATHDGAVVVARGECVGRILEQPRGRGGFDYDPIFEVEGRGKSMAELSAEDKNALSHRGRAFSGLRDALRARL